MKNTNGIWACSNCNSTYNPNDSPAQVFYVNATHIAGYYGSLPAKVPAGATITVPITVKNRSSVTWNATGPDRYALSYHLYDSGGTLLNYDGLRTPLPFDLSPGHEVQLNAVLQVPNARYGLRVDWDMVHEGITWFSERSERPLRLYTTTVAAATWDWSRSLVTTTDQNGDGRDELAVLYRYDNDNTALWLFDSANGYLPKKVWESGAGNWKWDRSKITAIKSANGATALTVLYDYGNSLTKLFVFDSDPANPGGYKPVSVWESTGWSWASSMLTATDYNGDGSGEVAVLYNYGNSTTGLFLFDPLAGYSPNRVWLSSSGGWNWSGSKITVGDYNGDGKDEIAALYDYGSSNTGLLLFDPTGSGYAAPRQVWTSGQGNWIWSHSQLTIADSGGRNGPAVLYKYDEVNTSLFIFDSSNLYTPVRVWHSGTGGWSSDTKIYKFGKTSLQSRSNTPQSSYAIQSVAVKPNTTYVFSGWIKTLNVAAGRGGGAQLKVISGGDVYCSRPVTGNTDWNLQTLVFTTGPQTTRVQVGLEQGFGGTSTGISWFDGVQLVEKSPWETTYTYDAAGNYVIRKTDPLGVQTVFAVNAVGKHTEETKYLRDSSGQLTELVTDISFDNAGRTVRTVYPPAQAGAVRGQASGTYDKAGNKLTEADVSGATTTYTYDAGRRKLSEEKPGAQLFADDFSAGSAAWTSPGQTQVQWALQQDGTFLGTTSGAWSSDVSRSGNSDWSWYELEADVRLDSGKDAGLEFHSADEPNTNLYYFGFSPSTDEWTLSALSSGSWSQSAQGAYVSDYGETYTLKVLARGADVEIYIKKKTDAAFGPSLWSGNPAGHEKGKVGLRLGGNENGAAAAFDNVTVREIGTVTRSYDNAGFLAGEFNWRGDNTTAVSYNTDAFGRVTAKTEGTSTTAYSYDEVGSKLTETDPRGNTSRYVYDSFGVSATFDRLGNLTSTVRSRSSDYMDLANTVDARGGISVDKSNASGIVSTTDERNYSVTNTYNAKGSLESRTDAVYSPYLFAYDVMGSPGYFTDPFGNETRFARDSLGRLTTRSDPRGLSQLFTYDNLGRMTGLLDSRGQAQFVSDITGRLVSFTNASEPAPYVSYEYDQAGNLTRATYSGGREVTYGRSSFGEIGNVKDAAEGFASYSYEALGRLDEMTSSHFPADAKLTLSYDQNGNLTGRLNPDGTAEEFAYDKENRTASFSLSKAGLPLSGASYEYDQNGNRTLASSRLYDYFTFGMGGWSSSSPSYWSIQSGELAASLSSGESVLKSSDTYAYTDFSARIKMLENRDVGLAFRIADDNNLYLLRASGIDVNGSTPQMALWKKQNGGWGTSPIKQVALSAAPALGDWYELRVVADGANIYGYFNDVLLLTHSDSTFASGKVGFRVAYGGGVNSHRFDDVALVAKTAYSYDAADQLISVTASGGATTTYTYDQNGNRTRAASTSGATYNYTYDQANQMTAIKDASGNTIQSLTYDKAGNTAFGEASYSYDERNRLSEALFAPKGSAGYSYDAKGRLLLRKTKTLLFADDFASGTAGWSFSAPSKWTATSGNANPAIQADGLAGATLAWRNATLSDLTFTARVKITQTNATAATAGLVIRSDANTSGPDKNEYYLGIYPGQSLWKLWKVVGGSFGASPVASGSQAFNLNQYYDLSARAEGGAVKVFIDGVEKAPVYTDASPYSYTNVGLRVRNAVALFDDARAEGLAWTQETKYLYNDITGALLHETDAQGNLTATYTADDNGDPVSLTKNGQTYYYHYNAHGDVVALTDSGGNIIATFTYDPWGLPTEYDAKGAVVTLGTFAGTPGQGLFFLFGGMLYDAALGLYLTRTRAYNPRTGRFLQRDILDEKGKDGIYKGFPFGKDAIGTNLYAWCLNNPVNRVDPSGDSAFSDSLRSFARALIYAIVYVVKMVMWNNMVRIANQRAQAIKQLPPPVARPRSYTEYVFGRTSGSAGQWQGGWGQPASTQTNYDSTGTNGYPVRKRLPPHENYEPIKVTPCAEWSATMLENSPAYGVIGLVEGMFMGFNSPQWQQRRVDELSLIKKAFTNPVEALYMNIKDQWDATNDCIYEIRQHPDYRGL